MSKYFGAVDYIFQGLSQGNSNQTDGQNPEGQIELHAERYILRKIKIFTYKILKF